MLLMRMVLTKLAMFMTCCVDDDLPDDDVYDEVDGDNNGDDHNILNVTVDGHVL